MRKNQIDELVLELFENMKTWVSETEHVDMFADLVRVLENNDYDVDDLYGRDEALDEALEEVFPKLDNEEDYE